LLFIADGANKALTGFALIALAQHTVSALPHMEVLPSSGLYS